MYKCYAKLYVPNYRTFNTEIVDISWANTSNIEGLIEFIKNVWKINNFDIYFSILDYNHFKSLHNETNKE